MTHRALLLFLMAFSVATIVAGLAAAGYPIAECHPAVVFPKESCSSGNGGWWCDGTPVETRFCYSREEGR